MRQPPVAAVAAAALCTVVAAAAADFDTDFTGQTLRIDYYHTGTQGAERITLDRVYSEGVWPGSRPRLIDDTNLGTYSVEVLDAASERLLYSRGFCSISGEWEATAEARQGTWRTFPEAARIPEPRRPESTGSSP